MAVLRLLTAYDKSNDTRKDLLQTARDLAAWLVATEIDKNTLDLARRKINLWQTLKRIAPLDRDIQKEAFQLAEDSSQSEEIRVGAYLILDNQFAAESHFALLPEETQEEFKKFPIFRYWREA